MDLDFVAERGRSMAEALTSEGTTPLTVTYRLWTGTVFDPETQTNTPTYSDTETTALKHVFTTREVEESGGSLRLGDVRWLIAGNNLSVTPTEQDIVVEGTDLTNDPQWAVFADVFDVAGALHKISSRKVP